MGGLPRPTTEPPIRVLPLHYSIDRPKHQRHIQHAGFGTALERKEKKRYLCLLSGSTATCNALNDCNVQNMSHGWLASWLM